MIKYKYHEGGRQSAALPYQGNEGDCSVRALSIVTAKTLGRNITGKWYELWWNKHYDLKSTICDREHTHHKNDDQRIHCISPDTGSFTRHLMAAYSFEEIPSYRELMAYSRTLHQKGNFLVETHRHITAVVDGTAYDQFDSRHALIIGLYVVRKENLRL